MYINRCQNNYLDPVKKYIMCFQVRIMWRMMDLSGYIFRSNRYVNYHKMYNLNRYHNEFKDTRKVNKLTNLNKK